MTSSRKVLGRPHSACHSEERRLELPAHTRTIEARAAYFTLLHNFHFHWKQFHSEILSDAELFLFFIEIIEVDPWIWSVSLPFFASSLSSIHLQTLYLSILVHQEVRKCTTKLQKLAQNNQVRPKFELSFLKSTPLPAVTLVTNMS